MRRVPYYAEESRDPHRIAKGAAYGSVIGLGVLYVVVSYAFVSGWGVNESARAVTDQFGRTYDSAFSPVAETFVGHRLVAMMQVLAIISPFAGAMVGACWLLIKNRAVLSGDGEVPFIKYLPEANLAVFALGMVIAVWLRARRPEQYAALGEGDPDAVAQPAAAVRHPLTEPSTAA